MAEKKGFNVNSFVKGSEDEKKMKLPAIEPEVVGNSVAIEQSMMDSVVTKKKLDSTNKKKEPAAPTSVPIAQTSMDYLQQNIPYEQGYAKSEAMLDETIAQLNGLGLDIAGDMNLIRNSKTIKNKYYLLNGLTENAISAINAKLSAIKEKNKVRNDINSLEIKRVKDLKIDAAAKDDNTRISEMYSAFVNTPIGMMSPSQGTGLAGMMGAPSQQSVMMPGVMAMDRLSVNDPSMPNESWQQGLNPAQMRMLLQAKGTMDIAVIYDETTGSRRYAAIDKASHHEIPGVELPDPGTIYELDINVRAGYAKDSNRNVVYPLITIGNSMSGF